MASRNRYSTFGDDFSEWISFCMKKGTCPLLADPFIVAEFLLALADLGNNRASTIQSKRASISAIQRYGYFEDPTKHLEAKIVIRKINRKIGTHFKQARPINRHMLDRMLDVCGDDFRGTRNRMILLLPHTTLRRRSDLTSLRAVGFSVNETLIAIGLNTKIKNKVSSDTTIKALEFWKIS